MANADTWMWNLLMVAIGPKKIQIKEVILLKDIQYLTQEAPNALGINIVEQKFLQASIFFTYQ